MIDPRKGSGELLEPRNYFAAYGVDVQKVFLDAADFAFYGNGPDDDVVLVGIERKVLSDFITSKRDDRLAGSQLGKLMEHYQVRGVIIEGIWRVGDSGLIEVPYNGTWQVHRSKMLFRELDHFVAEMEYVYGVVVSVTANRAATAAYIVSRYRFFNDHRWEEHRRCDVIYAPFTATVNGGKNVQRGMYQRRTVPKVEKMVAQLDGVERMAFAIGQRYRSMEALVCGRDGGCECPRTSEEIAETAVEQVGKNGRKKVRLGDKRAESIFNQLRED